jgi:hypothetical protein
MSASQATNTIRITHRWSGHVLFECEATAEFAGLSVISRIGRAVLKALAGGADLRGANLRGADLGDADLGDADLGYANLDDADLGDADLGYANLGYADLGGANLRGANLRGANLRGANLRGANLRSIRADLYDVLVNARDEAPAFLAALRAGKVNGSAYQGECACLVGTIAKVRGVEYTSLEHDSARPIERFVLNIKQGDTPKTSQVAALVAEWTERFIGVPAAAQGPV